MVAMVLVACGGGDGTAEGDDDAPPTAPEAEADADADEQPPAVVAAEVTDENGMATVRPSAEGQPACDGIDEPEPGARLTFPTDTGGMLDAGPGPVTVEFVGCSNTFEANLVYDAFHGEDRRPTITESTSGGSMGDWGAFSFEETFWTPGEWTVVVYEDDAATGERQEYDRVTFSID